VRAIETDYEKVDWAALKDDCMFRLLMLQNAWQWTQRACPQAQHEQMVKDLYVPAFTKLAEFCACVEIIEEKVPEETGDGKD